MQLFDTLQNLVAGLWTSKDKATSDRFYFDPMPREQIDAAYRGDWVSRKVVDVPAFDMTREWRLWKAEDEQIEALEAAERALGLQQKVFRALIRGRLYGGSAIILGVNQGLPEEPLEIDRVGQGDLRYVHVANRFELGTSRIIRDVNSPWYGEPEHYQVQSDQFGMVRVHPSRVIRFIGNEIPDYSQAGDGWGDSVLQAVNDAVRSAGLASQGVAALIHEAKVDVIKVPRLMEHLSSNEYATRLQKRFTLANQMKSINNTLLLDSEEDWERKQTNFSQLPELIRAYLQIASGAADIPATRLLGQAPQGMNATGDSDIRNYYDRVAAEQEVMLRPAMSRLDEVLIRSTLGQRDPTIHYAWSPLWQMSEKEQAEVFKQKADAARAIAGTGGASPSLMPIEALSDALVNAFVEDGSLPGLEAAIEEYGKLAEQEEDDEGAAAAVAPPADPAQIAQDAAPRTLYVRRDVLNADAIIAHFKAQGFTTTLPADDLHVTVAFSRTPVDWMKMGEDWTGKDGKITINKGGPRIMERFGEATVLLFASSALSWRHEGMKRQGASWDHPEYQPHVTISYAAGDIDLDKIEPYRGEIVLGPEVFQEIKEDWHTGIHEE